MPVSPARRWWALGALMLCVLVVDLDTTVLNVSMPTLAREFDTGTGPLQWVLNAYTIVMAALFIPAGALADRVGRKKVMLAALTVFGAGSLLGAYATDVGVLIAARAVMGTGAAAILPLTMSILPTVFGREQIGKAMAFASVAGMVGFPLGPVLAGFLLDHFWWGSVLLVNIPIIAFALIACALTLPESGDRNGPRVAPAATATMVLGLAAAMYGVIAIPTHGWTGAHVLAPAALGLALLAVYVRGQLRSRRPTVDFGLFGDRNFLWGTAAAVYVSLALAGLLFVFPQYLRIVRGLDGIATGLSVLPFAAGMLVGGQLGSVLLERLGFRAAVTGGIAALAAGLGLGVLTTADSGTGFLATWTALAGAGVGASMVPAMTVILLTLPPAGAGVGSGLNQTLRGVGSALGVAVFGGLLTAIAGAARLDTAAPDGIVDGMAVVLAVCAVGAVITGVLTGLFLPGRAEPPRQGTESTHDLARTA
ncbi:MFS transporter [Phytomonospora endophytica]|uniref:EmrB/QacA subfamily drug resistance transporter n=1 Tax=Phytomonospora endophytica TaxID=714109 RepID=A0A841FLI3_9ACTN|nr:MFS transporter [Phytomonospora endophytica]MBB6034402.1 EmrB/QacA subfamily drug resistance transporter [Phytomonospora endophytica]GIG66796.1 MFS transporter [Phytomonospora endophytica]